MGQLNLPMAKLAMMMSQMKAAGSKAYQDWDERKKAQEQQAWKFMRENPHASIDELNRAVPGYYAIAEIPIGPGKPAWNVWGALKDRLKSRDIVDAINDLESLIYVNEHPVADRIAAEVSKSPSASYWLKDALAETLAHPNRAKVLEEAKAIRDRLISQFDRDVGKGFY